MGESAQPSPGASPGLGGTVTIFFSDIRGFTEYTDHHGDAAAYNLLQQYNVVIRRQVELFGGHVVKTQGDNFMVSFSTARGAILCAAAIQRALAGLSASQRGARMALGIGINTGEPIHEAGDFFGSTVNLASRICAAAGPGEILVSETTRYVAGRLAGLDYGDRGLHELKGFQEPQRLYGVVWAEAPAVEEVTAGEPVEAAARQAIEVLNRVLAVSHRDDPAFRPLLECQARASELRLTLARPRGLTRQRIEEVVRPFEDFLALVTGREQLDDQEWSALETAVSRTLGRELTVAASRGRLGLDLPRRGPEAAAPVPAPAPAPAPAASAPPPAGRPAEPARAGGLVVNAPTVPPLDPRGAGVPWWAAAYQAWREWKLSGIGQGHAIRGALQRHPHLLAVPILQSAEHDGGRLAAGYALLLDHVEDVAPLSLGRAVEWALQGTAGPPDPGRLGARLYQFLVQTGRLPETYGAFLAGVMGAAIPHPGPWVDASLVEREGVSVLMARPDDRPGETAEQVRELTTEAERGAERRFALRLRPLTARFVRVRGEVKAPRDAEVRVTAAGEPAVRAVAFTLRTDSAVHLPPREVAAAGLPAPGLGRDWGELWVGVYNPDPEQPAACEVSVAVAVQGTTSRGRGSLFARPFQRQG